MKCCALFLGIAGHMVIAVLALLLGLLPAAHAIGPSQSCADDVAAPAFVADLTPPLSPFLAAYRANGPPEAIVVLITNEDTCPPSGR